MTKIWSIQVSSYTIENAPYIFSLLNNFRLLFKSVTQCQNNLINCKIGLHTTTIKIILCNKYFFQKCIKQRFEKWQWLYSLHIFIVYDIHCQQFLRKTGNNEMILVTSSLPPPLLSLQTAQLKVEIIVVRIRQPTIRVKLCVTTM